MGDFGGRLNAEGWVLDHHSGDDLGQLDGYRGTNEIQRDGPPVALRFQFAQQRRFRKWNLARQEMIECAAHGIDVGPRVGAMRVIRLFGRHVVGASHERAELGGAIRR